LQGESSDYNLVEAYRICGRLNAQALIAALNTIVRRHEVLRTRFVEVAGTPFQIVEHPCDLHVSVRDLRFDDAATRENAVRELISAECSTSFALDRAPLMRAHLLHLHDSEWVFIYTVHHIVFDGWSRGVFNAELNALYEALCEGRPEALEPLPLQYADFAQLQIDANNDSVIQRQLDYWRQHLRDVPTSMPLAADRPRTMPRTHDAGILEVLLPPSYLLSLKALASRSHCTLYPVLLSAFSILLARQSGEYDVVIGSPIANRRVAGTRNLIGCFVNSVVMRSRLSPAMTCRDALSLSHNTALDSIRHQDVPFERLVREVAMDRRESTRPLLQVSFALQNAPWLPVALKGTSVQPVERVRTRMPYELALHAFAREDQLRLAWLYNEWLFDRARIDFMAQQYVNVLDALLEHGDELIGRVSIIGTQEHKQIATWSNGKRLMTRSDSVLERLTHQVAIRPSAFAVIADGSTLTYEELENESTNCARYLASSGIGPGVLVGTYLDRNINWPIAVFAILKAGGTYVPIDTNTSTGRMAEIIANSGLAMIITNRQHLHDVSQHVKRVACIEDRHRWTSECEYEMTTSRSSADLAYVIYTSGTTGQPKGVQISHGAVAHYVDALSEQLPGVFTRRYFCAASAAFSSSIRQLLLPLCCGGTVVVAPQLATVDPQALIQFIVESKVEVLDLIPTVWQACVDELERRSQDVSQFARSCVRTILTASEPLRGDLPRRWHAVAGRDVNVVNMYGLTETCGIVATYSIPDGECSEIVPLGTPIANTTLEVLDERLQAVGIGVVGDIYVSGPCLASGVVGGAEGGHGGFVVGSDSRQMYRTGDRGRWNSRGNLEFCGRTDTQVKLRGIRIELQEIEAALKRHPGVIEAVVMVREGRGGQPMLVGYINDSDAIDLEEMRSFLRGILPDYMIPSRLIHLAGWPRTLSGKVDRGALPLPENQADTAADDHANPTLHEDAFARVFAEVLEIDSVSPQADFFALGGHSLLAVRLAGRIRDTLGIEIQLNTLLAAPTPSRLAKVYSHGCLDRPLILPSGGGAMKAPLSYEQESIWRASSGNLNSATLNLVGALRVTGPLNHRRLALAFAAVINRHAVLRMCIEAQGTIPIQVVGPARDDVSLHIDDIRNEPEQMELMFHAMNEASESAFRVGSEPLVRLRVLSISDVDHVIIRTMHRIAADGWSLALFNRDLFALYATLDEPSRDPLPELPLQYLDYALWQRGLAGPQPVIQTSVATGTSTGASTVWRQAEILRITVSENTVRALQGTASLRGFTLRAILVGTFAMLQGRASATDNVVVRVPVAGRFDGALIDLIGCFEAKVPIAIPLGRRTSCEGVIAAVQRSLLQEQTANHAADMTEAAIAGPMPILVFAHHARRLLPICPELSFDTIRPRRTLIDAHLEVHSREQRDGSLLLSWLYDPTVYSPDTASTLAHDYVHALEAMSCGLREPLSTRANP